MAFDFTKSLQAMQFRKFGDDLKKGELFDTFSERASHSVLYVSEAMEAVSKEYTDNTYKQCDRVIEQLKGNISESHQGLEFEYQGSVPLNVHIKKHSDIDLLVATGRYHVVKSPVSVVYPYTGNPKNDMIELRQNIIDTIKTKFPAVDVDNSGGKAISIGGGSLKRKIDLVPISWIYNTESYNTPDLMMRGVRLYDYKSNKYIENYPFLHISRCNLKDSKVGGRFKMLVRYIKNIIKDADIKISSYDAAGLIYLQEEKELSLLNCNPMDLSLGCEQFLTHLLTDSAKILNAMVPNETRKLFGDDWLSIEEVRKLRNVIAEINSSVTPSYKSLLFEDRNNFERIFRSAS